MPCSRYAGVTPVVHPTAFVHPTAVLIGDVIVGPGCYVGPLASLRGDFGRIVLDEGANLQDTCVIHGFPESVTRVARNGPIGHGVDASRVSGGRGMISNWCTHVPPWRCTVPRLWPSAATSGTAPRKAPPASPATAPSATARCCTAARSARTPWSA